jgi:hypothetical protein
MGLYKVRIIETSSRVVEVEVEDGYEMDALNVVEDMYRDGGVVLDSEDFDYVEFEIEVD